MKFRFLLFVVLTGCGGSATTNQQLTPPVSDEEKAAALHKQWEQLSDAERTGEPGQAIVKKLKDIPGVQARKLEEAIARRATANNIRQLGMAIHQNFEPRFAPPANTEPVESPEMLPPPREVK